MKHPVLLLLLTPFICLFFPFALLTFSPALSRASSSSWLAHSSCSSPSFPKLGTILCHPASYCSTPEMEALASSNTFKPAYQIVLMWWVALERLSGILNQCLLPFRYIRANIQTAGDHETGQVTICDNLSGGTGVAWRGPVCGSCHCIGSGSEDWYLQSQAQRFRILGPVIGILGSQLSG
jgi:hypothetical protein